MSLDEELDEFLDTEDGFSITALYNGSIAVIGNFSNEYFPVPGELADTESAHPRFGCKAESLPDAAEGDTLQIAGIVYDVAGVQPDGTGWLVLALVKH